VADHGPGRRALIPAGRTSATVLGQPAAYLEGGQGRSIVLVHGAGGRADVWTPQVEGLAGVARLVAVDLPGHGGTGAGGCRRVDDYAVWVLALLDGLGLDRAVLVGHSMGGAIVQTLALGHPERVAGLVLVGTGARLRVLPRILDLFRDGSPEGAELVAGLAYSPKTPPEAVVEAERALRETPTEVTLGDFLACDRFDLMARLSGVAAPTLVVVGADDRLTPPTYGAYLARTIPGARLVEIEAAGHFPQLEQPAAVNRALRAFLAALP
jgi:pimeloyl-ACP methyl ester carboxylesterase